MVASVIELICLLLFFFSKTNPESDQGNERQGTGENVEWVDWMQKDEEVFALILSSCKL